MGGSSTVVRAVPKSWEKKSSVMEEFGLSTPTVDIVHNDWVTRSFYSLLDMNLGVFTVDPVV